MLLLPVPTKRRGNGASCRGVRLRGGGEGGGGHTERVGSKWKYEEEICPSTHLPAWSCTDSRSGERCLSPRSGRWDSRRKEDDMAEWSRVGGWSKSKNRAFVCVCQCDCLQFGHADVSEPAVRGVRHGGRLIYGCGYFTSLATHILVASADWKQAGQVFFFFNSPSHFLSFFGSRKGDDLWHQGLILIYVSLGVKSFLWNIAQRKIIKKWNTAKGPAWVCVCVLLLSSKSFWK